MTSDQVIALAQPASPKRWSSSARQERVARQLKLCSPCSTRALDNILLFGPRCASAEPETVDPEGHPTMCGRFTQKLTWRQIHDLYSLTGSSLPLNLQPRYNGAPAQDFAACRLDQDGNRG